MNRPERPTQEQLDKLLYDMRIRRQQELKARHSESQKRIILKKMQKAKELSQEKQQQLFKDLGIDEK